MSCQSSKKKNATAVLVAVVATLLFAANWVVVPCAGQVCATLANGTLAEVSPVGSSNLGPTFAQRVRIGSNPIIVSIVYLTLSTAATGVVEAQVHYDNGAGGPHILVSPLYVGQVETLPSGSATYSFVFSNAPTLEANTYYWIVFTSPTAIEAQWSTGISLTTTASISVAEGAAYTAAESVPADQVPTKLWLLDPSMLLTLTVSGCDVAIASSPDPSTSPTPAATPGLSLTPSATHTPSPSSTATAMATASLSPRFSRSPTPTPTPTPVPTSQSSRTPQAASASATPVVVLIPITANVTSSFDATQTALNLTAPSSTNGTSGVTQPGVTVVSQFSEVQVGNRTLPPPAIQELTVSNDTSTNTTTYTYASQLESTTSVEQAFTFFDRKTSANFSGLAFDIGASSVKWSIHLQSNSTTSDGLTLRYRLTGLAELSGGNSTSRVVTSRGRVVVQRETPQANMTTYLVPLFITSSTTTTTRTTMAQVELFDVALIDGTHFAPIGHSIVRTADNGGDNETAEYVVELVLPGFNESLFYDPSIGLGVLLGRNGRDDGGGSSSESNVGLIVGVSVAIPVAVALVLVVIGAALVIGWRQRQLARRSAGSINFETGDDDDDDHDDQL